MPLLQDACSQQRKCCWKPVPDINVPWCFFPRNWGYHIISRQNDTKTGEHHLDEVPGNHSVWFRYTNRKIKSKSFLPLSIFLPPSLGFTAQLEKLSFPSLFGYDVKEAGFTAEYQTSNRFHFKVGLVVTTEYISEESSVPTLGSDPSPSGTA